MRATYGAMFAVLNKKEFRQFSSKNFFFEIRILRATRVGTSKSYMKLKMHVRPQLFSPAFKSAHAISIYLAMW